MDGGERGGGPSGALRVVLRARRRLRYSDRGPAAQDGGPHVRAASAVVGLGFAHVVIQDDALFLGVLAADGRIEGIGLPAADGVRRFDRQRGNKRDKPDLEAATVWSHATGRWLVAFGSGSTPVRQRLAVAPIDALGQARIVEAPELYAVARGAVGEAELNLEGAWQTSDGALRLLQRGNGRGGVDAVLELDGGWLDDLLSGGGCVRPALRGVTRWRLGALGGVRVTFTDALPVASGVWWFTGAAEASPDAIEDGAVAGSVVGWCDDRVAAWAPVVDADGVVLPVKVEGLARHGDRLWLVTDPDDPDLPAELLEVSLEGAWPGRE